MSLSCSKEKLEEFSKKHYTYINQIFGDGTVREIIEEEYPTTYKFVVEETGADFDFSFHHTVKDREDNHIICSAVEGYQNIYKNKNDTLCQSYSLMNYFDIEISDDKKERQMAMIQMYRDIINGTLENFEDVNFKDILNREILSVKSNKQLWTDFVKGRGYVNMSKASIFKNIENTLDEWEEFGYWYFIGKGNCPKHEHYSSEMKSQDVVSREMSDERDEGYWMGQEDVRIKTPSKKSSKSETRKARSRTKSEPRKVRSDTRRARARTRSARTRSARTRSARTRSRPRTKSRITI